MRMFVIIIWCSVLCFSCSGKGKQPTELTGTKWECKIADGCINIYEFTTENTFKFFSCEMEDEYFGEYYFKDGILILDQKGSVYDENFPDFSIHRAERKLYKVEIKGDKLKHLSMSDWVNGEWIESNFEFDDNYLYQKVN